MVRVQKIFTIDLEVAKELETYSKREKIPQSWIVEANIKKFLKDKKKS